MGRWGFLMFQGDSDMDALCDIQDEVGVQLGGVYAGDAFEAISTEYEDLTTIRNAFDAGKGDTMLQSRLQKQRAYEKYEALVLAAVMMHVGAKINPNDRQRLSTLWEQTSKHGGYVMPLSDDGFRLPGAVQFKAALDSYVDGVPHSFFDPCCYNCGKLECQLEVGTKLKKCARCVKLFKDTAKHRIAHYCGRDCQAQNWQDHKDICKIWSNLLNV